MKKTCTRLLPACLLLALPGAALSTEVSVDATGIVRFEQRAADGVAKKDVAPATQFLGLDVEKLADGKLSFHASGWAREDLRDKSYNNDTFAGSLTYGYLQYRFAKAADARLGRFLVHEGIANEHIDGASIRSDLPLGFGVSAFGGANVHTKKLKGETTDGKGDAIVGGRVNYRLAGLLELGASGVYESNAPEVADVSSPTGKSAYNRRLAGGDIWLSPFRMVEVMGHSAYNTETRRVAEHTYLLNIKPLHHLVLTGEFNEHRERDFAYSSLKFSESALDPGAKSRSYGGGASYAISKNIEVTGDYKHFTLEKTIPAATKANADRYGGDVKLSFLENSVRAGLGYHYLRAGKEFAIGDNPSASYHELRAFAMHDSNTYFAAVDVMDFIFKDKVYAEKSAWEAIASIGYHVTPGLSLSGDFSYGRNPQFTEEVRGLVRMTYNLTHDSKGGRK